MPPGQFQIDSFISCNVLRNRILPSGSRGQLKAAVIAYILGGRGSFLDSHDQQLKGALSSQVLRFLLEDLWLLEGYRPKLSNFAHRETYYIYTCMCMCIYFKEI